MTPGAGFVSVSLAVAVLAAVAFAAAAALVGSRAVDVVAGSVWSFLLTLIVALPMIAARRREGSR